MIRGAGTAAVVIAKDSPFVHIKLPSGEVKKLNEDCFATVGMLGNIPHKDEILGKAGRKRLMGIRPTVRGTAQNPRSHPHGGGEGRVGEKACIRKPVGKARRGANGHASRPNGAISSSLHQGTNNYGSNSIFQKLHISPKKLRFILPEIKKMTPAQSLDHLFYSPRKGSRIFYKAVKSAIDNAKYTLKVSEDLLKFKVFTVEQGNVLKRFRPGGRGTAKPYKKRFSHVKIVLEATVKPGAKAKAAKAESETGKSCREKDTCNRKK
jgi:ribosomal protein L2